ncbi:sulfate adenylyltransferase subunit CysN [Rhizobiaceae bacterium BDR2-2]|uniref:Bifunctional enzyme NodQ n=1 Tax=Ectorhizobium quercum TaxID=2965071 RepID=A0AAE3MX33_9HYPH|nr:sulfate adenylyltransferase subunit CysN [Ectorhizobium quercum]MCX8996529.1 sulfate adenylyltransferase subunit CysN [Ectorhizobium quercum]
MSTASEIAISASATIIPFAEPGRPGRDTRPLRLITCGSVDDGKSTLIGRLLWDTKAVKEDQAASLKRDGSRQNDLGLPDFALLLDGLQAEREQGITIDVAYRYFATDRRSFIVADTPGHEQYTRNMATGASTADLAVLLIDARAGLLEQTRRHATIASLMGIRQFVLAVNKIDLVDYSQFRFEEIATAFREFARNLGPVKVTAIPMSALKGENVVSPAHETMPWYEGPTLVETLEFSPARSSQTGGFRLPVQRVARPGESFRGYQGTVAGGAIKPGDAVTILPSGETAHVRQIVTFDLVRNAAVAGDAVTLVLDRQVDVARGDMIVSEESQPMTGLSFAAKLVALQPEGIEPGKRYWLKAGSRSQRVVVEPQNALDLATGRWNPALHLPMNAIGSVRLDFEEMAIFDAYLDNRTTGAFILIDPETHNTIAGGMITARVTDETATEDGDRVLLSLPADLAEKLLSSDLLAQHRDRIKICKLNAGEAKTVFSAEE